MKYYRNYSNYMQKVTSTAYIDPLKEKAKQEYRNKVKAAWAQYYADKRAGLNPKKPTISYYN